MRRRDFIRGIVGSTAAWPLAAGAQQPAGRTARIGVLRAEDPVTGPAYPDFLDELRKSGFIEGQNLEIETVTVQQDAQRLFAETADLTRSKVELLVATGPEVVLKAAMAASQTIPIVMWAINYDPIARGYVKSLARPGGNITGVVSLQTELAAKQVELLTEAFPERVRLAVLYDGNSADQFAAAERQARSLH
jgi:putative tryptophan/tyrosine transport system substrate-binding protein